MANGSAHDQLMVDSPAPESDRILEEDSHIFVTGYKTSILRIILTVGLVLITGGTSIVLFLFRPSIRILLTKRRCSLEFAEVLLVEDKYGHEYIEKINRFQDKPGYCFRFFIHKKLKYIWNNEFKHFKRLRGLDYEPCSMIYSQVDGEDEHAVELKLNLYGPNLIEVEILPIWKLIFNEIFSLFYIYQAFIIIVWMIQLYYQFATCILILSIIAVATHVWQTRKQSIKLREKIHSSSTVTVIRDSERQEINSINLVPGDVIVLPIKQGCINPYIMECDAVLINGNCTMDESMITGESKPVSKVPLSEHPSVIYSPLNHKTNTLFSGTKLLNISNSSNNNNNNNNTDDDIFAVVIRTGFNTVKGELARQILFPEPKNRKFKKQLSKLFFAYVILIGIPSWIYTFFVLEPYNFPWIEVFIVVIDVATFLIPPVLPAIITSVNLQGQYRLKKENIFCIEPETICSAGEIDLMCFDKTGTLTEDTIDFTGMLPMISGEDFGKMIEIKPGLNDTKFIGNDDMVLAMAACHSLVLVDDVTVGGDLDYKLFNAIPIWTILPNKSCPETFLNNLPAERIVANNDRYILIIKQFPFESRQKRMTVMIYDILDGKMLSIVKGAPEKIKELCNPRSLPENYDEALEYYSSRGFRVLATASKKLPKYYNTKDYSYITRDEMENSMTFNGFFLFKNKVKPGTTNVITELLDADIRCVMSTGDNILTGINIAQECLMIKPTDMIVRIKANVEENTEKLLVQYNRIKNIDRFSVIEEEIPTKTDPENRTIRCHIAIDGDSFMLIRSNDLELAEKIVHCGTVFARMTPNQKCVLINMLQNQGHSVGMCGDGANDCGALRTANAGISLSAEASLASPFTYKFNGIECVPILIREGRCTLVSMFGSLKYQISYCFILLAAAMILFWHGLKPSDGTYVYVDIIMNILPPMVFSTTKPYPRLAKRKPYRNFLSFIPQTSMYLFILMQIFVYYYSMTLLLDQPWYEPVKNLNITIPPPNQLSYTIFACNSFSYVIAAIIFAPGPPYRKNLRSNKIYMSVIGINLFLALLISPIGPKNLLDYLDFIPMPLDFRFVLLGLSILNLMICFIIEKIILENLIHRHLALRIRSLIERHHSDCFQSKKKFKMIEKNIRMENWPFDDLANN